MNDTRQAGWAVLSAPRVDDCEPTRLGGDTARYPDCDAPFALCGRPQLSVARKNPFAGFSLLEVIIAMAVFFIVVFAILGIVVQSVTAAKALGQQHGDCGTVASYWSLSNKIEPGIYSGDLEDVVKNYAWEAEVPDPPPGSNGLYLINIRVFRNDGKKGSVETLSMLKFTGQKPQRRP